MVAGAGFRRPVGWPRRDVLARFDDAAADFPGSGEHFLELVAIAIADGPLQYRQILRQPAQHLEDGAPVGEKNITPHDGIGCGNAGKIPAINAPA